MWGVVATGGFICELTDVHHGSGFTAGATGDVNAGKIQHYLSDGEFDFFREIGGLSKGLADQGDGMFLGNIG